MKQESSNVSIENIQIKSNFPKMTKLENQDNAKRGINIGSFTSTSDYLYFKQHYPTVQLQMNKAELFAFDEYDGIYAMGVPYNREGREGLFVIYKNFNNNKTFSILREVKLGEDTIMRIMELKNSNALLEIVKSKGNIAFKEKPENDKCDENKNCFSGCPNYMACVKCVFEEMGAEGAGLCGGAAGVAAAFNPVVGGAISLGCFGLIPLGGCAIGQLIN